MKDGTFQSEHVNLNDILVDLASCFAKAEGGSSNTNLTIQNAVSVSNSSYKTSILLENCKVSITSAEAPCFEVTEVRQFCFHLPQCLTILFSAGEFGPIKADCSKMLPQLDEGGDGSPGEFTDAVFWRNKTMNCEKVREFETRRKTMLDAPLQEDKQYWQTFETLINQSREANKRLQQFFTSKIDADLAYAESLHRLRFMIDTSINVESPDSLVLQQTSSVALNSVGELQQLLSEKIAQFTAVLKRDVISRPFEEMALAFEEKAANLLVDGKQLDSALELTQKRVLDAFSTFDTIFTEMVSTFMSY